MTAKNKRDPKKGGQLIISNIPLPLKREFKATCARQGHSMRKKLLQLMTRAIQEERGQ